MNIRKFSTEKKIGLLFFTVCTCFSLYNLLVYFIVYHYTVFQSLTRINVLTLFILALLFLSTSKKGKMSRLIQTLLILFTGIITVYLEGTQNSYSFFGMAFFIFSILLALEYGLLNKYFYLKIGFIFIIFIITLFFAFRSLGDRKYILLFTIQRAMFIGVFLLALFFLYGDNVEKYIQEAKNLKLQIAKDTPYVELARNQSFWLHSIKNKIHLLKANQELLKLYIERGEYSSAKVTLGNQDSYLDNFTETVFLIESFATMKQNNFIQKRNIKILMEGILMHYSMSHIISDKNIKINMVPPVSDIIMNINPHTLSHLMENLLNNSIDSLIEKNEFEKYITISLKHPESGVEIHYSDTGKGIEWCNDCAEENCLLCKNFRIGQSTKVNGSGQGMVFVIESIKNMKGNLLLKSERNKGITVIMQIPDQDTDS